MVDEVTSFGRPYPTIVFTGGDPLERNDLFELMSYAKDAGVRFAVSPAVTGLLTQNMLRLSEYQPAAISISLDGASPDTHDSIRRVPGTFDRTVQAIRKAIDLKLNVQVNTAVMKRNFRELPQIFHLIKSLGVKTWEVFFLVRVGRGSIMEDLSPEQSESVCNFLFDASRAGLTIRCVEAPFIRRIVRERDNGNNFSEDETYLELRRELVKLDNEPSGPSTLRSRGTLDGDGILFIGHDGSVYPGGLLPVRLGRLGDDELVSLYRESETLRMIRARRLNGPCGVCEFRDVCGGSRARSYAYNGDPLGSDPACVRILRNGA